MRIYLVVLALAAFCPANASPTATEYVVAQETFSVDFPDEDVRTIIRNIADVHELNVVIPDSLRGRTSIKLRDVTWEQAYKVLLAPLGWRHEVDGDIILIKRTEAALSSSESLSEDDMLSRISRIQTSMQKTMLLDKDFADALATFHWNLHSALIEKGFTKEEALRIVISSSIPSAE